MQLNDVVNMMYARIYIYMCVCVSVCVYMYIYIYISNYTIPCKTLKTNADRASHVFDAQPARPPASKGLMAELPDLSGLKMSEIFGQGLQ